jgi:hypothetical protein
MDDKQRKKRSREKDLAGRNLLKTVRKRMMDEDPEALEKDVPKKYEETKKKISNQEGGTKGSGPKGGGSGGGGAGGVGFLKLVRPPYKKMKNGGEVKKKKGRRGMGLAKRGGGIVA